MKNYRYMLSLCVSTYYLISVISVAQAAEVLPEGDTRSTGIEVGAGLNTIVPYGSLRLNHDFDQYWTGNVALQFGPEFTKTNGPYNLNALTTAGVKYYFSHAGWFQPFVGADIGVTLTPETEVFGQVGLGSDFMFHPNWGISLALRSNLLLFNRSLMSGTLALRPEIASVWRF
jgi:hypothetical protein